MTYRHNLLIVVVLMVVVAACARQTGSPRAAEPFLLEWRNESAYDALDRYVYVFRLEVTQDGGRFWAVLRGRHFLGADDNGDGHWIRTDAMSLHKVGTVDRSSVRALIDKLEMHQLWTFSYPGAYRGSGFDYHEVRVKQGARRHGFPWECHCPIAEGAALISTLSDSIAGETLKSFEVQLCKNRTPGSRSDSITIHPWTETIDVHMPALQEGLLER